MLSARLPDRVHDAAFEVEPLDLGELDGDAGKAAQHVSERGRDLAGREHAGRDLVQQRLEEVVVASVDERHVDALDVTEETGRGQPAEASPDHDHVVRHSSSMRARVVRRPFTRCSCRRARPRHLVPSGARLTRCDHLTRFASPGERPGTCRSTTTSSSSGPARVAARWRTPWRRREADPAARTGQLPAARDGELGSRPGVRRRALHLARHVVRRRRHRVPAAGALLRRRRDEAVRRRALPAATAGLRRAAARRRRCRRPGRCRYDDFEPYYTKAEWLYQVHGNHGEDPTEGHWSKQYPWPAVSHEPRIQQLVDDLRTRRATTRSTRRAGSCSTRPTRRAAPASGAPGATATRASSTPSPTPRPSRYDRCSGCPT